MSELIDKMVEASYKVEMARTNPHLNMDEHFPSIWKSTPEFVKDYKKREMIGALAVIRGMSEELLPVAHDEYFVNACIMSAIYRALDKASQEIST